MSFGLQTVNIAHHSNTPSCFLKNIPQNPRHEYQTLERKDLLTPARATTFSSGPYFKEAYRLKIDWIQSAKRCQILKRERERERDQKSVKIVCKLSRRDLHIFWTILNSTIGCQYNLMQINCTKFQEYRRSRSTSCVVLGFL